MKINAIITVMAVVIAILELQVLDLRGILNLQKSKLNFYVNEWEDSKNEKN